MFKAAFFETIAACVGSNQIKSDSFMCRVHATGIKIVPGTSEQLRSLAGLFKCSVMTDLLLPI